MSAEHIATGNEEPVKAAESREDAKTGEDTVSYGAGIAISTMAEGRGVVTVACPEGLGSEVYHYETL